MDRMSSYLHAHGAFADMTWLVVAVALEESSKRLDSVKLAKLEHSHAVGMLQAFNLVCLLAEASVEALIHVSMTTTHVGGR